MRFDQLVRPGMTMREVRSTYPQTTPVFEDYGFREVCADCTIEVLARKHGLRSAELVDELNQKLLNRQIPVS